MGAGECNPKPRHAFYNQRPHANSHSNKSKQELDARDGMARRGVHLIIRFPRRLRVPKANLLPKIFGGVVEAVDELGYGLGGWDQYTAALPCWHALSISRLLWEGCRKQCSNERSLGIAKRRSS